MISCDHLEAYRDGALSEREKDEFVVHIATCDACRLKVSAWDFVVQTVLEMAEDDKRRVPASDNETAARIEAAFASSTSSVFYLKHFGMAAAALFLVAVGVYLWLPQGRVENPRLRQTLAPQEIPISGVLLSGDAERNQEWPAGTDIALSGVERAVLAVDSSKIGVDANTRLSISSNGNGNTVISLRHGRVVAKVAKRKPDSKFAVVAGQYTVRVVGTVFAVECDAGQAVVSVVEGAVEVMEDEKFVARVEAGGKMSFHPNGNTQKSALPKVASSRLQMLLSKQRDIAPPSDTPDDASALQAPDAPKPKQEKSPSEKDTVQYDTLESWIIEGRYDDVRQALRRHLKKDPVDVEGWSLLANCEKRARNWDAAVRAYRKVIAGAGRAQANTARFKAGVILQEQLADHVEAEKLFRQFVEDNGTHPLAPQALLRQARSLRAQGKRESADAILKNISSGYAGSAAAVEARRILGEKK